MWKHRLTESKAFSSSIMYTCLMEDIFPFLTELVSIKMLNNQSVYLFYTDWKIHSYNLNVEIDNWKLNVMANQKQHKQSIILRHSLSNYVRVHTYSLTYLTYINFSKWGPLRHVEFGSITRSKRIKMEIRHASDENFSPSLS